MNDDLLLPDSELDPELRSFVSEIRAFCQDKVLPHARAIDEEIRFRPESVAELAAAGILGGPIATEHGGAGWDATRLALAHEEIGAVCGNTRGFLAVHAGLVAHSIATFGTDAQRERWLPLLVRGEKIGCFGLTEPEAGSDVVSLITRADKTAGGYALHGRKIWITNGGIADVALVFATVDPSQGKDGITAFLVETDQPGLRREKMPGVELGHRGSDHAQLIFEGIEVSEDAILGGLGKGFEVAMTGLSAGRLSVAAGAVGIIRAALEASIDFVQSRQQFGRPIAKFQMVQERIADMTVDLLAARALVLRCARRRDHGIEGPGDLAVAKLYATEAASKAADQAIMLHGGRGYTTEYPVERLLRDSLGLRIYEGTSIIQKGLISRAALHR